MPAAFSCLPDMRTLLDAARTHRHIIVCLPDREAPRIRLSDHPCAAESQAAAALRQALSCLQFAGANMLDAVLPGSTLWLMPPEAARRLHEYFDQAPAWLSAALPQTENPPQKPWFKPPQAPKPQHVAVIGAGISGAATAYELAGHGVRVSVLEAHRPAHAASGNRQGLLYAKVSPHPTEQTELLLCGYGHTRRLLERLLPGQTGWGACGVLHLNHNDAETERNIRLGAQAHHAGLYRSIPAEEASRTAGLALEHGALYWPQGVWINPPSLVDALLAHPGITLHSGSPLLGAHYAGGRWRLTTPHAVFEADCIVYCTGASAAGHPALNGLALRLVRGQTSLVPATDLSEQLCTALSGASYIVPAWQGIHCYGATFVQHDSGTDWRENDEAANRSALAALHPELAASLLSDRHSLKGHAALRCDSNDHLPAVGALSDPAALRTTYAKLASDRKFPADAPCPYLPAAYVNTAHGSRGLASAPLCAAALAAEILGLPRPLSRRLQEALHPNRFTVRALGRGR